MNARINALEARKATEAAALAAATSPAARRMISARLQSIRSQLAEAKSERAQYAVPRPCSWLK